MLDRKELRRKINKKYNLTHKEQRAQYYQNHKEQLLEKQKKYYWGHLNQQINASKQWKKDHPDGVRKSKAKRRGLGFIPLNEPFEGAVRHHIDKEHIVFIPRELHESVHHSVLRNENMTEINNKVFAWLNDRNIYIPQLPLIIGVNNYV